MEVLEYHFCLHIIVVTCNYLSMLELKMYSTPYIMFDNNKKERF